MKNRVTIHKNELKNYFVLPGTYKLGKEKMNRWVDIPEYIQVQTTETIESLDDVSDRTISDYAFGFQQGVIAEQKRYQSFQEKDKHKSIEKLLDTNEGVRLVDFGTTQHVFNLLIAKINELIERINSQE